MPNTDAISEFNRISRKIEENLKATTDREWIVYFRFNNWDWSFTAICGEYKYISPSLEVNKDIPLADRKIDEFVLDCTRYVQRKLEQAEAWQV